MDKLLPRSFRSNKGFTLIELMVAITILAILATIGMTLFSDVQKKGRDSRRKGDVDAMSKALESGYNAQTGLYPVAYTATMFASGLTPVDPKNTAPYVYTTTGLGTATYTVCAQLENTSGNFTDAGTTGNATNTGTFYCKKGQQ